MKVLLAIDLHEPASFTRQVEQFISRMNAELLVLHVESPIATPTAVPIDPLSGVGAFMPYAMYDPAVQEEIEEARQHAFERFLLERFSGPIRPALRTGNPAGVIVDDAKAHSVDMIILGKRQHPFLERVLLGSVTADVVKNAALPVLLLPIAEENDQ